MPEPRPVRPGRTNSELEADVARLTAERDEARTALAQAVDALRAIALRAVCVRDPSGVLLNIESIARHALREAPDA